MNIHQLYGKAISEPVLREYEHGVCYTFTFLYYSMSPFSRQKSQSNFVEVELNEKLWHNWKNIPINKNRFWLNGFFYQNRWQDETGVFHSNFHFYVLRIETLSVAQVQQIVAV